MKLACVFHDANCRLVGVYFSFPLPQYWNSFVALLADCAGKVYVREPFSDSLLLHICPIIGTVLLRYQRIVPARFQIELVIGKFHSKINNPMVITICIIDSTFNIAYLLEEILLIFSSIFSGVFKKKKIK